MRRKQPDFCLRIMNLIHESILVFIYILNNNNKMILIRHKVHFIDDLSIKVLIEIDIMKSESIILDTNKNLVIIDSYNSL